MILGLNVASTVRSVASVRACSDRTRTPLSSGRSSLLDLKPPDIDILALQEGDVLFRKILSDDGTRRTSVK